MSKHMLETQEEWIWLCSFRPVFGCSNGGANFNMCEQLHSCEQRSGTCTENGEWVNWTSPSVHRRSLRVTQLKCSIEKAPESLDLVKVSWYLSDVWER